MASVVIGNPHASGPTQIIGQSGQPFPFSGMGANVPIGGIQLRFFGVTGSGVAFIGFSGNMTVNSGQMQLSGGANSGLSDGMPLRDGDSFFIPRSAVVPSGVLNVFVHSDALASGVGRIYWQLY